MKATAEQIEAISTLIAVVIISPPEHRNEKHCKASFTGVFDPQPSMINEV
jgi:hypothetical protein